MFGIQSSIIGALGFILVIGGGLGYWYYTSTQNTIAILNQNIATYEANELVLELEIEKQNQSILLLDTARARDQQTVVDLSFRFGENQVELDTLQKKFDKHKLSNLTIKKPGLIQKIINRGSVKVFKEFEDISDPATYGRKITNE